MGCHGKSSDAEWWRRKNRWPRDLCNSGLDPDRKRGNTDSSSIWGGGFRVYPVETVPALLEKFKDVKFARLTAPAGSPLYVNAELVVDRNDRSVIQDLEQTKSVLCFGTGADAPRIRIRETTEDLVKIWDKLGVATDPLL